MALVTVAQVDAALRLDLVENDDRTADIELKIKQAEDMVLDFVQPKPDPAWTADDVPGRVSAAIIMAVGFLLDGGEEAHEALAGLAGTDPNIRSPLVALLWRLRTPSLA